MEQNTRHLQVELWKECENNCLFCQNRGIKETRSHSSLLDNVVNLSRLFELDILSITGGEIFGKVMDDKRVYDHFFLYVLPSIMDRMKEGHINKFMVCTALMFQDPKYLVKFLNVMKEAELESRVIIATSWDLEYRFKKITLANWERNMNLIKEEYPGVEKRVTMILTGFFLNAHTRGVITLNEFEKTWDCKVDFSNPSLAVQGYVSKERMQWVVPDFFPKRKQFVNWLLWCYNNNMFEPGNISIDDLLSMNNQSDHLFYSLDGMVSTMLSNRKFNERNTCVLPGAKCKMKCCGYIDNGVKKLYEDIDSFKRLVMNG